MDSARQDTRCEPRRFQPGSEFVKADGMTDGAGASRRWGCLASGTRETSAGGQGRWASPAGERINESTSGRGAAGGGRSVSGVAQWSVKVQGTVQRARRLRGPLSLPFVVFRPRPSAVTGLGLAWSRIAGDGTEVRRSE
jgi:hypothetical protein